MRRDEQDQVDVRFAAAWRNWAQSAPRKSPAAAAASVAARLSQRKSPWLRPWVFAAAAAVLVAFAGTTALWRSMHTVPVQPPPASLQAAPMGKGEVLIWIDDQTPLYMTFQPPEGEEIVGEKS